MRTLRLREALALRQGLVLAVAWASSLWALSAGTATAQEIRPSITITPPSRAEGDLRLQLEVYLNGRPLQLVSAFILKADGRILSPRAELEEIGLKIPARLAGEKEIPLDQLPGVGFQYDEPAQVIRLTAGPDALKPTRITGRPPQELTTPVRPPPGLVVNYSLFASGAELDDRFSFDGLSGDVEMRLFGPLGLLEHNFIARTGGALDGEIRLDTRYSFQDPGHLRTYRVGDVINGGFSWTRPIRMGGVQVRRSFGLRPDLLTVPLPRFTGTAATPSTLDLYINQVRAFSAQTPAGPFEIDHPPVIYGGGTATLRLRDVLGREVVTTTAFYASPDLLGPGLTDYSVEVGYARRNFGARSNDYGQDLIASASWRRGLTNGLTVQAHVEGGGGLALVGGGAVFIVRDLGLASVALAGSHTENGQGGLIDLSFESHRPSFSFQVRTQRLFGDYEDLASRTAVGPLPIAGRRHIFGQPREIDQISVSAPLPWQGASAGASFVNSRRHDDKASVLSLSVTQGMGKATFYASAFHDFETADSTGVFIGVSFPLGGKTSGSIGASRTRGDNAAVFQASRQGGHEPGAIGWSLRASQGERREVEGIGRYSTTFARFEGGLLHGDDGWSGHLLAEGAVAVIGGGVHFSQPVEDSFALVEVGVPGIPVLYENRRVGLSDRRGQLLVPNLTPFASNRIAIDASALPVDAQVETTEQTIAPFSRVAARVDFKARLGATALVGFVDVQGRPLPLGAQVSLPGQTQSWTIGYDGQAFLEGLEPRNSATVTLPDSSVCRAQFVYRPDPGNQVRIDGVACRPGPP